MATTTNYTTRQAASIGLQPGNLIGETHYVVENQITPPIKQRIRSTKLLSTNISRCQCCCPPCASSLCRSCLCPCWAYVLIGLLLTLLVAALATEIGLLTREKIITQTIQCTNTINNTMNANSTMTSVTSGPICDPPTSGVESCFWSSFSYLFLLISILICWMKNSMN